MTVTVNADPGIGRESAPVGTEAWAQRVRLHIQSTVADLPKGPESFARYYKTIKEHRAWTLLNRPDGSKFATWEEFCAHRQPWGLGKAWPEIKPFLLTVVPEKDLDLATVAPPATSAGPGRGHKKQSELSSDCFSHSPAPAREAETLRAINRAPEPVRALYTSGLLGQKEAAKLGPKRKDKDPAVAARVTEIALELAADAKKLDASTDALKEQAKRALNVKARALLGIQRDRIAEALRAIEKLSVEERTKLIETMSERGWLK